MAARTRFAPSPTGPLHLGHAYSAMIAAHAAKALGGTFLLRIEDIDQSRARPQWEAQIYDDLAWLGLSWPKPVLRQSDRLPRYSEAVRELTEMGLTYPCRCKRADIEAAANAPQEGVPQFGPDGRIYPGTCRTRSDEASQPEDVLRLNIKKSIEHIDKALFLETGPDHAGTYQLDPDHLQNAIGDIILVRRNMGSSYHLSVVLDDAEQGITHVHRGADLFEATHIHVLLQQLLKLPTPVYHHHKLIRDTAGKRLAKRDDARAIATYRADGAAPEDIFRLLDLTPL
ncbi:tRNA glutamyl-Q(34) synthetase GluQRS [Epibacterium ulvae]|uniref:tRNA glutamyl-Q(34) synthetase GluQRS n=1 Tax=Epibacterium ulvae TaxID=1156985 RepID=UPI002490698B|nr:tRNA glutamyl-Q(34) synthetase GluQRS [Epibacterium ulvae]